MKTTIKDQVEAAKTELVGKSLKELYRWAEERGMGNRSAFSYFKAALLDLGICDWDATREANAETRAARLAATVTHEVTLYSDYKMKTSKFAVVDVNGKPIWYGVNFDNLEQSAGELDTANKAIWFAMKIKEAVAAQAIRLNLFVDAQWLTTLSGKASLLSETAQRYNVELNIEWIPGDENPADPYTVERGYKKWSENDLASLVNRIEIKDVKVTS